MNPRSTLAALADLGIETLAQGGKLVLKPASRVPPALLAEVRRLKPHLIALLRAEVANASPAPLPLGAIIGLVQRLANATPAEAPEVLRAGIAAMLAAGHGQGEALETLMPAVPLGADADMLKIAIWDASAPPCEVSQRHRPPVGAELGRGQPR